MFAAFVLLITCVVSQNTRIFGACTKDADCVTKSCNNSKCGPKKCDNDKTCIDAGLTDHFCRDINPKIFNSECEQKRGLYFRLSYKFL